MSTTTFKVQFRANEFGYEIDELQVELVGKDLLATEIENHLSSRGRHDQEHIRVVVTDWGEAIVYSLDDEIGRADILG
ncbi:hypothetical protein MOQ72_37360 [Saccharopolyspora sp. K220]|uniref:hypothetical protein n=1 Tax=Saccharopolyspora soli TaxID=2926618 RepID=UPI001F591780|nr:hypothetical protein [Saccharopolyspora soli]MCI2423102.1 hypothetical protein [Saccharopolyspora soli]